MGPKGDQGAPGRDWDALEATWTPLEGTDLDQFPHPVAAHVGDAAVDLQTTHRVVLAPHTTVDAHTGWTVELHPLTSGEVLSRSGLSGRGVIVANAPGLVDSGYRGEVIARLHNLSDSRVVLEAGDRVAQFRVVPTVRPVALEDSPERGEDGLGSTGLSSHIHQVGEDGDGNPVWAKETDTGVAWSTSREVLDVEDPLPEAEDRAEPDMVNQPPHYTSHAVFSGECWDYVAMLTPAQYAAAKYLWRWNGKGDPVENLEKALWYLDQAMELADSGKLGSRRVSSAVSRGLDVELTEATESVIHASNSGDDPWFTAEELAAATAFIHVVSGDLGRALSWTRAALRFINHHTN